MAARPGVKRNPLTKLELNTLQMLSEGFKPRELVRSCENYHNVAVRIDRMRLKLDCFTTAQMCVEGLKRGLTFTDYREKFLEARRAFEIQYFALLMAAHKRRVSKVAKSSGVNRQACYTILRRLGLLPAARQRPTGQLRTTFAEFRKRMREQELEAA